MFGAQGQVLLDNAAKMLGAPVDELTSRAQWCTRNLAGV